MPPWSIPVRSIETFREVVLGTAAVASDAAGHRKFRRLAFRLRSISILALDCNSRHGLIARRRIVGVHPTFRIVEFLGVAITSALVTAQELE